MAGFLYYLSGGAMGVEIKALQEQGLGYAFDKSLNRREIKGGPDRGDGVLLSDCARVPSELLGYWPEKQTWRKIPGIPANAWSGFYADNRPTPEDLARPEQLPGHWLELLDGRQWLVPMALEAAENGERWIFDNKIPVALDLDDEGRWTSGPVLPVYRRFHEVAEAWFDDCLNAGNSAEAQDDGSYQVKLALKSDVFESAVQVLSVNYAIGRIEAAMLGLLSEQKAFDVLNCAVDLPGLKELQKKTAAASASSASPAGPGDATAASAPA